MPDELIPADAVQFDNFAATRENNPAELYSDEGDTPLYNDNVTGGHVYFQMASEPYAGEEPREYGDSTPSAPAPSPQQYGEIMGKYDNAPAMFDTKEGVYRILEEPEQDIAEYKGDDLTPVSEVDIDAFLTEYETEVAELMRQYELDPEEGWEPLDEQEAYSEEAYDVEIDESIEAHDTQEYRTAVEEDFYERLLEDGPDVYARYLEDSNGEGYLEFAEVSADYEDLPVVEHEMSGGLFGFVDPTADHPVAHVNKALYKIDKEPTRRHESSRATGHPSDWGADELQIRYKNGDIDVQNTLSFQANQVSRIGTGSGRILSYGTDHFGVYGPQNDNNLGYAEA